MRCTITRRLHVRDIPNLSYLLHSQVTERALLTREPRVAKRYDNVTGVLAK